MEKEASRRTAREIDVHCGKMASPWVSKRRRRRSSWEIETACGLRELFGEIPARERWDRIKFEMVVAVPWRKNEDTKMDGEHLRSEVIVMNKEYKENFEAEEHVPVPSECTFHVKMWREFGFTVRCPGCMSLLRGTARQAHTENCRRRIEEELKGTAKAHAATRRIKEYQDRAADKGTKRTKADQEEERQQREHGESTARMEEDAPNSSSSGCGDVVPTQSSSSSAVKTDGREGGDGCKEAMKKRKAEEEHPEDPERDDGKWMRTDGYKRKAWEESEESRLRKTVRFLKDFDKMENKKESGKTQEVVEVAEVEVNEEEEEWMTEEEPRQGDEGGDLDPEQVRQGREEEMNYMVKTLKRFEFGSWEDATSRTSKMPTTTKWVDRARKDDAGKTFVRCRSVARDFKPKREGPRDDLFAAMPSLEAKKALFAFVAGVREKRRAQGHDEVKLMFVDVKKAHLNATCDEEEWVELPNEFKNFGRYEQVEEMAIRNEQGGVGMGGRLCKKTGGGRVSTRQSSINDILPSQDAGASRRAR